VNQWFKGFSLNTSFLTLSLAKKLERKLYMEVVKTKIVKVERNSFNDTNGKEVKYTKFRIIEKLNNDENCFGYDYSDLTTKYDHFDKLKDLCKAGADVELEFEYVARENGTFKRKPSKLNNVKL